MLRRGSVWIPGPLASLASRNDDHPRISAVTCAATERASPCKS